MSTTARIVASDRRDFFATERALPAWLPPFVGAKTADCPELSK